MGPPEIKGGSNGDEDNKKRDESVNSSARIGKVNNLTQYMKELHI